MRFARTSVALVVAVLAFAAIDTGRAAAAARPLELTARASISAAELDVQPAFDPALIDARAASSGIGTSSLSSVVWPSFLVDAFFFLYGFQDPERLALGIAQAGWPQGPGSARATISETFASNLDGVADRPFRGGSSSAAATSAGASARAVLAEGALPGGIAVQGARSSAEVDTSGETSRAEIEVSRIEAGPVAVEALRAVSTAGRAGRSDSLSIGSVEVAGIPVRIDGEHVRAPTRGAQQAVDQALASSGVTLRILDADGSSQRGLLIEVAAAATDPAGGRRDVRLGFVFGDVLAEAVENASGAPRPGVGGRPGPVGGAAPSPGGAAAPGPAYVPPVVFDPGAQAGAQEPARPAGRWVPRVVRAAGGPAPPASAGGAYAAFLGLAVALLSLRPLVRQAARP